MSRESNKVDTVSLTIRTTPKVIRYLDQLVKEELYGKTPSSVAEELIRTAILQLIEDDKLEKIK